MVMNPNHAPGPWAALKAARAAEERKDPAFTPKQEAAIRRLIQAALEERDQQS